MKWLLALLFCAGPLWAGVADIIPAAERVDWTVGTNVGVRGGIPTDRTQSGSTIAAGASTATIQTALNAASSGTYVLLGAGAFSITTTLTIPSNVTLRGSGVGVTYLNQASLFNPCIQIGGGSSVGSYIAIDSGYTKGSTNLTAHSNPSLSVGDFIGVTQDTESWMYNPESVTNPMYAIYRVESGSSGTSVNIWPALLYGSTGTNPKFQKMTGTWTQFAGMENLSLAANSGTSYPIQMNSAYCCWVKNVDMATIPYSGIFLWQTLGCEITHFDVHGTTSTGDGYGVDADNQTPGNNAFAIYNCIFDGLFVGVYASGQNGAVIAYNYTANEHPGNGSQLQSDGMNISHGCEGMMTLWEGNYGNKIRADNYHGGVAYQTIWRNRFHGVDNYFNLVKGAVVQFQQGSPWMHVVGNVLGDPLGGTTWPSGTTSFYRYDFTAAQWDAAASNNFGGIYIWGYVGYQQALDANVASTRTRYSNYDYWNAAVMDTTGSYSMDNSLAWAAKPSWFASLAWPAYDPAAPLAYGNTAAARIPAGYRAIYGVDPPQPAEITPARTRRGAQAGAVF